MTPPHINGLSYLTLYKGAREDVYIFHHLPPFCIERGGRIKKKMDELRISMCINRHKWVHESHFGITYPLFVNNLERGDV